MNICHRDIIIIAVILLKRKILRHNHENRNSFGLFLRPHFHNDKMLSNGCWSESLPQLSNPAKSYILLAWKRFWLNSCPHWLVLHN